MSVLSIESNYKKFSLIPIDETITDQLDDTNIKPYIKVLLVPLDYSITIDFVQHTTGALSLFFVNSNQILQIDKFGKQKAQMLCYNRDFYCIQIHDDEVACDGLLFNNIFQMPCVPLDVRESGIIENFFDQIAQELSLKESSAEEMIRTYLKQIIIKATRIWKRQNLDREKQISVPADQELFRDFGRLVEIHFRKKHTVAEYADLLFLSPKTLANKFNKMHLDSPNDIIKNRIVLEAKRLLYYTDLTVKEIAYQLGYDDPAYFNRLFAQKEGIAPSLYRKQGKKSINFPTKGKMSNF